MMNNINYQLAIKNPDLLDRQFPKNKKQPIPFSQKKKGKKTRLFKRLNKVKSLGVGCPWSSDAAVFRVELVFENKLLEQANFSLHWISVRRIKGRERTKYLNYFEWDNTPLSPGETIELRHLLCYLDGYYQENYYKNPNAKLINNAFIYPARKVGDKSIHYPIARRLWEKEKFLEVPITKDLLAVYANTIYHQNDC